MTDGSRSINMEWDARHIVGLCLFVSALVGIAFAYARESKRSKSLIMRWADGEGLTGTQLHSTSLRPHPQIGKAKTGDVTYRLTAVGADGRPVTGFVKCNTFRLRRGMPANIEAQLTPIPTRGFPITPASSGVNDDAPHQR